MSHPMAALSPVGRLRLARCVVEAGMGFAFAPVFHPAMRHAAIPRRELGVGPSRRRDAIDIRHGRQCGTPGVR